MLHLNTIDESVRELLVELSSLGFLEKFALAGGTSLALQIGHRKSIDIDLFAFEETSMTEVSLFLENTFKEITIRRTTPVFIFCNINQIKCDFVKHSNHRLIHPIKTLQGIKLFSVEDIAAMKLNAICGRGSKKDFYDIYSLLKIFTLQQLLDFYDYKFQSDNSWMALRSIIYFEDADQQEEPVLIEKFPAWSEIKKSLVKTVHNFKPDA